ncbi:hypothetical protein [Streptomyces sp. NRRL F-5135]|uniref:hypothetical protein n=1 Tax=Streptomyces sp. NRRL F-5135 TaxID=1463858 RepID=UPI0004C6307E|nr:hypothetical protein [Streptomyces sp. NRRL F-5135]
MASPTKPKPVLEKHYKLKEATDKLGLSDPENPDDKTGQRWLRDGVNLHGFPCRRMAGQLRFSESDLAEISELSRERRHGNSGPRRKRRPRKTVTVATLNAAA